MIKYVCDWCSRVKGSEEAWILGLAAEALGVTSARREVTIRSGWERERAVDPLAVHFCSVECKDKYMAQLFAPGGATEEVMVERAVPAEIIVERVIPTKKVVAKARAPKSRRHKRAA
jgi:hypothetical protein